MSESALKCGGLADEEYGVRSVAMPINKNVTWKAIIPIAEYAKATGVCIAAIEDWAKRNHATYYFVRNAATGEYEKCLCGTIRPMNPTAQQPVQPDSKRKQK